MAERLFRMVELVEGETEVQFLAVYALRWRPEWGEPQYGFVEVTHEDVPGLHAVVKELEAEAENEYRTEQIQIARDAGVLL